MDKLDQILWQAFTESYPEFIKLGFAAVGGGLLGAYINDLLTRKRETESGVSSRRREFRAFMQQWKHEIDRWHFVTGGRERKQMAFYDGVSSFCVMAETVRNDFMGQSKDRFSELVATITKHGKLEYGCKHEDLIKTIDELLAITEKN